MPDDDRTLSHVGNDGQARMVDVTAKPETERVARAGGTIRMAPATLAAIQANTLKKGDVIGVARVAGIMAAKRTAELIPLCHSIPLTDVQVDLVADESLPGLRAEATVRTFSRTGVEMEAISAVCVTLITVFDMAKALDKGMLISDVCVLEKHGGRSGSWRRA
ncbi:MAG: cyclic pyranopterin monophosphate synthase MoaC [Gemmatimonadaceae bacterium]